MNDVWITFLGIIIGVISTFIVSSYYYKRSIKNSLVTYIRHESTPLKGVDQEVSEDIKITYKDHPIENLSEIQFLIANNGDRAIKDVIEPLTLHINGDAQILDASIVYIYEEGRKLEIEVDQENNQIVFHFPLLNSGEFFITKVLYNGQLTKDDYYFSIIYEDVPPKIKPTQLPSGSITTKEAKKVNYTRTVLIGMVTLLIGLCSSYLLFDYWKGLPNIIGLGFFNWVSVIGLSGWASIVSIIPVAVFLILGVIIIIAGLTGGSFPPQKKFLIPEEKAMNASKGINL